MNQTATPASVALESRAVLTLPLVTAFRRDTGIQRPHVGANERRPRISRPAWFELVRLSKARYPPRRGRRRDIGIQRPYVGAA